MLHFCAIGKRFIFLSMALYLSFQWRIQQFWKGAPRGDIKEKLFEWTISWHQIQKIIKKLCILETLRANAIFYNQLRHTVSKKRDKTRLFQVVLRFSSCACVYGQENMSCSLISLSILVNRNFLVWKNIFSIPARSYKGNSLVLLPEYTLFRYLY